MSKLTILKSVLNEFGERTKLHGMQQFFSTRDRVRQIFWLLLFTASLVLGCFHMAINVRKYTESTVRSQLKLMSEEVKFPDITICNLKPASNTFSMEWTIHKYIKEHWEELERIFGIHRDNITVPRGTRMDYQSKVLKIRKKFFDVLWASADLRDLSHLDETMLLHCRYNDVPCSHKNFSLLQTSKFWNCYTFHADERYHSASGVGGRGAELDLVLYTDGYEYDERNSKIPTQGARVNWINGALQEERIGLTGLRLIFHQKESYPFSGGETLDVASGSSSKIRLRPIRNRMISSTERRCSEQPLETVRYVSSFSNGSRNVRTKEYTKSVADYVFEAKQRVIQHSCGCLSHHYPFPNNTSQLCYFVPYQFWKSPPGAALNKIKCHDEWFSKVEKLSSQLANEFRHRRWCEYFRQRPSHMSSSWPPFESVVEIWDHIIVPHIVDGIEFLPNDGKEHHIYSQMEDSRQAMMFGTLILNERACLELFCVINITFNGLPAFFCTMPVHQLERSSYCVRRDSLANNLAAVRISLEGSTADAYEEETGFDWTEALSEVGGTLGLWLGVSIVSALELVELVYILVKNFLNSEQPSAPETSLIETSRNPDTDHGVQTTANGLPQCKERQLRIYTGVSL